MSRELHTHAVVNENCEYQSSYTDSIIEIDSQKIQISINIINCSSPNENNIFYYDDKLEIQAAVFQGTNNELTIQTGRIEFYYIPNSSNKAKLLNKEKNTCILSKNGTASIYFKPNQSGEIRAKYIDNNGWFKTEIHSEHINLTPIPVSIKFDNSSVFSNSLYPMDESIDIKTIITPTLNHMKEYKINYGYVTFFEQIGTENRMIGNPVPVVNGEAQIKYMPSNESIDKNTNLQAIYNYDIEQSTLNINNWEYFQSNKICNIPIYIYKKHSILLKVNDNNAFDGQQYKYQEGDNIDLVATLIDENNDEINTTIPLKFHIEGESITINDNYSELYWKYDDISKSFQYNEEDNIEQYFNTEWIEEEYDYETIENYTDDNNQYKCYMKTISNLKPGEYTISATTDDNSYSNIIYITVDYKTISYDTQVSYNIENSSINIVGEVYNMDNNYIEMLNEKRCYFLISKKDYTYTYEGTLSYNNKKLISTINNNLSSFEPDDYSIYMYLLDTYYKKDNMCIKLNHNNLHTNIIHIRN